MAARIILLDLETAPGLGYVWGAYEQNVIKFKQNWFILSFAYKVLGEDTVQTHCLPDYPGYKKDKINDKWLVQDLWDVFDDADVIVAHNGDAFDIKRSNARFVAYGMVPPSPYKTVDTLKQARKHFKFDSNKLSNLAQYLDIGDKLPHTGFKLWEDCINGDPVAWKTMEQYNAQDILLLEQVYLKLRPWGSNNPNLNLYAGNPGACPACGGLHVQRRGITHLKARSYQRLNCQSCGHWFSGEIIKKTRDGTT